MRVAPTPTGEDSRVGRIRTIDCGVNCYLIEVEGGYVLLGTLVGAAAGYVLTRRVPPDDSELSPADAVPTRNDAWCLREVYMGWDGYSGPCTARRQPIELAILSGRMVGIGWVDRMGGSDGPARAIAGQEPGRIDWLGFVRYGLVCSPAAECFEPPPQLRSCGSGSGASLSC